jgi:predicted nucleotidyltransferase
MDMVTEAVKTSVRKYLAAVEHSGIPVRLGFVFGSQANGLAREDSDIDLVVVSSRFDQAYTHSEAMRLWELTAATDIRIEPMPCGEREWETEEGKVFMFVEKNKGEVVSILG